MTQKQDIRHSGQSTASFYKQSLMDHPWRVLGIFLGDTFQAAFTLMIPFAIRDVVDAMQGHEAASGVTLWQSIEDPFTYFVIVTLLAAFFSRFSGMLLAFYAPLIRVKPRLRLVDYLQSHSVNYFQSRHSGALGNKINDACNGMANGLWVFVFDIWPMVTKLFFSVFLLFLASKVLGLSLLAWAVIYFAVMCLVALGQSKRMEILSNERSRITGQVVDIATNIQTVKSYAQEEHERARLLEVMRDEKKAHYSFQILREAGGWFHSIMSTLIMLALVALMLGEYEKGTMSLGDMTFVFSIILIVTEQARGLSWGMMNFLEFIGQMRDGIKTIMKPQTLLDRPEAKPFNVQKPSITFDHVDFAYNEAKDKVVFSDLNLDIPAYQKVGLIGPSGAGKSSLVSLMMRFHDLNAGQILLDGKDITQITQDSLRRNIAVIPQDTSLFHRSLMENIRYGDLQASDEQVVEAAKKAFADEFIQDMPDGYQTMVGERGVRLSGGQRQRIAIARALLKNAPVLILDEATSALDSESEKSIQDSLQTLMDGKTVIAIAHRLSTIKNMDRLIVMDQGRIVEDGTHDELLKQGGVYAHLWSMQSGGFIKES